MICLISGIAGYLKAVSPHTKIIGCLPENSPVMAESIKAAIISLIKTEHLLVEGASGVALAALLKTAAHYQNKNVVIILSGGNISLDTLKSILSQ